MISERFSLGFLNALLITRPDWLSIQMPERYLEISTCYGNISPDFLSSVDLVDISILDDQIQIELGIDSMSASKFRAEKYTTNIRLGGMPSGDILGYAVLGFEWGGSSWHSQNCHNFPDSDLGRSVTFISLGLISREEDAIRLAEWYMHVPGVAEPVPWFVVSVHSYAKTDENGVFGVK